MGESGNVPSARQADRWGNAPLRTDAQSRHRASFLYALSVSTDRFHIRFFIEPKGGGAELWEFESQPPQWYRRVGVSRKLFEEAIGQTVAVTGRPARSGIQFGFLLSMEFEDGRVLQVVRDIVENQE